MSRVRLFHVLALLACAAGLPGSAEARVYKCVEASGKITYSDIACPHGGAASGDKKDAAAVDSKGDKAKSCDESAADAGAAVTEACRRKAKAQTSK